MKLAGGNEREKSAESVSFIDIKLLHQIISVTPLCDLNLCINTSLVAVNHQNTLQTVWLLLRHKYCAGTEDSLTNQTSEPLVVISVGGVQTGSGCIVRTTELGLSPCTVK